MHFGQKVNTHSLPMAKSDLLRKNTISKLCKQINTRAENHLQNHSVIMVLTPCTYFSICFRAKSPLRILLKNFRQSSQSPAFHGPKAYRSQFTQRAFLFSQTSAKHDLNALPTGSQSLEMCLQSSLRRWLDMENLGDHVNDALEKLYRPYDRKNSEP
jgi:hypothetical protein